MCSKLDEWMRTLARCEGKAIASAQALPASEELIGLAVAEIRLNSVSVRNWLKRLASTGYKLNDDLSRVELLYIQSEEYRRLVNHIEHHLVEMQRICREIRTGPYVCRLHATQDQDVSRLLMGSSKG